MKKNPLIPLFLRGTHGYLPGIATFLFLLVMVVTPCFTATPSPGFLTLFTPKIALAQPATFDCALVTEIPTHECQALVDLYTYTDGDQWLRNTNWLQTTTPCYDNGSAGLNPNGWVGVRCKFGKISALKLADNRLAGTLPATLGALDALGALSLENNRLQGTIPPEIGNLSALSLLNLSGNQLSGRIPVELGNLTQLELLSLQSNFLSGSIPAGLANLAGLSGLYLSENRLQGPIPAELGQLSQLTGLSLSGNQLAGTIPTMLADLTLLDFLDLSDNRLVGPIPPALAQLPQLYYLALDVNGLSGPIPPALGNLRLLTSLVLSNNRLTGTIPPELGNLTNLTTLQLHGNQLHGPLPPELGNLRYLKMLLLHQNGLSGPLPVAWHQLTNLRELTLAYNQLQGPIPPEWSQLAGLQILQLQYNQLSGPLPAELGNLTNLTWLLVQGNQLTGTLPSELGNLTALTDLALGQNQLQGPIPASLGNLTELRALDLHENQLAGSLPAELGKLVHLRHFYLQDNNLFGALPLGMVNMRELEELNLDHNGFFAPLPSLQALLDAKAPGWSTTQTLAPAALTAHQQSSSAIALTWSPIAYTIDGGFYEVSYATDAAGPFTVHGHTPTKATAGYTIDGLTPATAYVFRVRTYTPAHHAQQNDLWSTYTPVVSAGTASGGSGDAFEPDNDCNAARTLTTDGRLLDHTVHQPGDVDWLQFNGQAGVPYRIDVQIPANSPVDATLEIYADCAGQPVATQNESFSRGVRLDFTPAQSGPLLLKLTNSDPSKGDAGYAYRVAVRLLGAEMQQGAVILVAGGLGAGDPLQANVNHVADSAYTFFRNSGYSDAAIHYLAATPSLPGVDGAATTALLRDAIVSWALNKVAPTQPLTLYLLGDGATEAGMGQFVLNRRENEVVTAAALSEWLAALEASIPGVPMNVIIDAPYAGSFISGTPSLSKPGRVILTATTANVRAFASQSGLHFSDQLLTALRQGHHLFGAFWEVRTALFISHRAPDNTIRQEPWLDSDGNGNPNTVEDALQASLRSFAGGATAARLWAPTIADAQVIADTLQVYVNDDGDSPVRVWALLYRPAYAPALTGDGFISEAVTTDTNLAFIELQSTGNHRYVAGLNALNPMAGTELILYAQDNNGLQARPSRVTDVRGLIPQLDHAVYLPLLMR